MQVFARRFAAVAFGLFVLMAAGSLDRALALTAWEAEQVVSILERLKDDDVQIAYDSEAADDLFEQDAEEKKLITAAGFSQAAWKQALDDTMKGFFATLPEADVNAMFADMAKRLDATTDMTDEQKKAMREWWSEQRQQIATLRTEGKPFAETIAPLSARLKKVTFE
jgi:DnaJ-domain-containing protein 1